MTAKWWEKTVEYQFIIGVARSERLYLAPLDGPDERMGDTILAMGNRWILIEFKKDENAISTEKKKFSNYDAAAQALSSRDGHHYLVFGEAGRNPGDLLWLGWRTYFSGETNDLDDMLASGCKFEDFKKYVEDYVKFKKPPKSPAGGGGFAMDSLAMVAGVNTDNNIVRCMSMAEFGREFGLALFKERAMEIGRGGPSR